MKRQLNLLETIKDEKLKKIFGIVKFGDKTKFKEIENELEEYDTEFLWLLAYTSDLSIKIIGYIEEKVFKYRQILDSKFLTKLIKKKSFTSRMWELVLCDLLFKFGKFIPKSEGGSDFIYINKGNQKIQIEAVCPNESEKSEHRAFRPDYSDGRMVSVSGKTDELELPILLRTFNSIKKKAKKYDKDFPLIIAINLHKVVGIISLDEFILRKILFGLGNQTITRKSDGTFVNGLENNPIISIPNTTEIITAIFRNPDFSHISGIIYSSQNPTGLVPGGWGWNNQGITYVENPIAKNKVIFDIPYFHKMICNESIYMEEKATSFP